MPSSLWIPEGCLDYALAGILREGVDREGLRIELRLPIGSSGPGGWRGAVKHALGLLSGGSSLDIRSVLVFLDADSSARQKISWVAGEAEKRGLGRASYRVLGNGEALGALFDSLGGGRLGLVFWCNPSMRAYGEDCSGRVEDVLIGILGELYGCRRESCYSIVCRNCPGGSTMARFAAIYDKLVGPLGLVSCSGSGTLVLGGRDGARCGFDVLGALREIEALRSSLAGQYVDIVRRLV